MASIGGAGGVETVDMDGEIGKRGESFISRGGEKLAWALDHFGVVPAGWVCADLGANVGGFTQCLLRRGAARVYAVDTGYGALDYSLRRDSRVVVMERTNALHVELPERCDLVVIDLAWTPQRLSLPKARDLAKPGGLVLSLVKPQYEAPSDWVKGGRLDAGRAAEVAARLAGEVREWGFAPPDWAESGLGGRGGNREYFFLLRV